MKGIFDKKPRKGFLKNMEDLCPVIEKAINYPLIGTSVKALV